MLEVYHKEKPQKFPISIRALQWYFKNLSGSFPNFSVKILWKLFTRPGRRKIQARHTDFLNTGELDTMAANGVKVSVYTWKGEGKSILLVHGWKGMTADFRGLIKALHNEGHHIVSADLPGHGTSEGNSASMPVFMDAIQRIVQIQGPFDIIIGHSLGATSTLYSIPQLEKNASKPERLVLIGLQTRPIVFFEQIRNVFFVPQKVYDQFLKYGSKVVKKDIEEFRIRYIRESLEGIAAFIIIDEEDEVVDQQSQKVLREIWPEMRFYGSKHGGHYKNYRHPVIINKIVEFLKSDQVS